MEGTWGRASGTVPTVSHQDAFVAADRATPGSVRSSWPRGDSEASFKLDVELDPASCCLCFMQEPCSSAYVCRPCLEDGAWQEMQARGALYGGEDEQQEGDEEEEDEADEEAAVDGEAEADEEAAVDGEAEVNDDDDDDDTDRQREEIRQDIQDIMDDERVLEEKDDCSDSDVGLADEFGADSEGGDEHESEADSEDEEEFIEDEPVEYIEYTPEYDTVESQRREIAELRAQLAVAGERVKQAEVLLRTTALQQQYAAGKGVTPWCDALTRSRCDHRLVEEWGC